MRALVRQRLKLVGLARVGNAGGVHVEHSRRKVPAAQHDHRPAAAVLTQSAQRRQAGLSGSTRQRRGRASGGGRRGRRALQVALRGYQRAPAGVALAICAEGRRACL